MDADKVYMTIEQAEEIEMAINLGMYYGDNSRAAHALMLLAARDNKEAGRETD